MSAIGSEAYLDGRGGPFLEKEAHKRMEAAQLRRAAGTECQALDLNWEEWDGKMPFWKHAVAGSCAGIMEHVGMFPLDTLKTCMQALRPGTAATRGMGGVLREIVGRGGTWGFMHGCTAIIAGTVPAHICLFTTYELTKNRLLDGRDHDPCRAAVCGAAAQFSHDLFLTPADVVKQRMQLGSHSSATKCLMNIVRLEGVPALFRSMPTTLAMNMPFGAVLVAVNESLKDIMGLEESIHTRRGLVSYFFSAGVAGGVAASVTQPLDVIKTRLQTQDCLSHSIEGPPAAASQSAQPCVTLRPKYDGFIATFRTIMREEGAAAFFYGLAPRILYTIPAAAICWGTYDSIKSFIM
eukprot:CAMPEP_0172709776 /NCGR_PEP_ID=MMETSP1074-20121228/55266_1 /TAXON_ID=2916 /ORGANISM="Ceratium fusus, Strain PA161109" /LENGTH=350 /DNA_ID=CAMNT_0013533083 /DNA_START=15 /DNA_END=1067 /DNA_ORIENTATION=-